MDKEKFNRALELNKEIEILSHIKKNLKIQTLNTVVD